MTVVQNTQSTRVFKLLVFFALVYVAEGLGQIGGLIDQPLNFFLLEGLHWSADQINNLTIVVLGIPWIIKPIYGIVSDFIPLFGYRRRTYLFLFNLLAVCSYLWVVGLTNPVLVSIALFFTALGMAASSTVCGAVMIENGKETGLNSSFINQQWLWFNIAALVTAFTGGWLCEHFSPKGSFHMAAFIVAIAPVGVMLGCWFLIDEKRSDGLNKDGLKSSWTALRNTLKSKTVWLVSLFLFFFNFSPAFGTPLYVHMTKSLNYQQNFIGDLGAISAFGSIVGSFIYMWLHKRLSLRKLLNLSILIGALSQLGFVFLGSPVSAVILNFFFGIALMIALVTSLTLAADFCPDKAEGFSYAALLSISNAAEIFSSKLGSWLYDNPLHQNFTPLVLITAGFTALAFLLVPLLGLDNMRPGEKAEKIDSS